MMPMVDNGKGRYRLHQSIAAVQLAGDSQTENAIGVATTIPAGEVIELQELAPIRGMREIRWKGSVYALFPGDLLQRANRCNESSWTSSASVHVSQGDV